MKFKGNELNQLTPNYLSGLPIERLQTLVLDLSTQLMDALDRENRNPANSSKPPSSRNPWDRDISPLNPADQDAENSKHGNSSEKDSAESEQLDPEENQDKPITQPSEIKDPPITPPPPKNKQGKQKGAKGFGRMQKLEVTGINHHKPKECKGCGAECGECMQNSAVVLGAYYTLDVVLPEFGKIGMSATYIKHIYYKVICSCGFQTDHIPLSAKKGKEGLVHPGERGLIGPTLLALIVFLKQRIGGTISKSREFLAIWLGILLSDGCISKALSEAGVSSKTMEPQILEALKRANLLYVDETTWKLHKVTRWAWVAVGDGIVYYKIGPRTKEVALQILEGFTGWLMTDGAMFYREFTRRVRCWTHIERKAKGLSESYNEKAGLFGKIVLKSFELLRYGVYKMRELQGEELTAVKVACEVVKCKLNYESIKYNDSKHEDTKKLAVELSNDPKAMFAVLNNPSLPITNNVAEREFRWIVTLRKISHGSKTQWAAEGFAALASIIGTLHARKRNEWLIPFEITRNEMAKTEPLSVEKLGIELLESIMQSSYKPEDPKFRIDTVKERETKKWIWTYMANLFSGFRSMKEPPLLPNSS